MSLPHLPEPWRPNAIYRSGDRGTLRDERAIFVLQCEKSGKGGLQAPRIPAMSTLGKITQSLRTTTIVKVWHGECDWRLEKVIRKAYGRQ
jgi:hypothetical protein